MRRHRLSCLPTDLFVMAKITFQETLHDRVLYGLFVWFVGVFFLADAASSLALSEGGRVLVDMSYTGIHLFSLLIVSFYGCFTLFKEKERRTLPLMLSKPVSRAHFIVGKFLGIMGLVLLILLSSYLILWGLVQLPGRGNVSVLGLFYIINLLFLELALFTALAFLFSIITTSPFICFCFTGSIYLIGLYHNLMQSIPLIQLTAHIKSNLLASSLYYLSFILPNFERFNISLVLDETITANYMAYTNLYGLSYTGILLALAVWVFSRKKLLV